jgi:hypothetical protein
MNNRYSDSRTRHLMPRARIDDKELCAPKPVQVKILQSQYEQWMELPAEIRTKILREAIANALENRESLIVS